MLIKLGRFEFTECWDGVLYKNLPDYPRISEWEIQSVLDFIRYEEDNGRTCEIEADEAILNAVEAARREKRPRVPVPQLLTECTACPKYRGCMTDFVCHTSPVENAVKIFNCGSLLSPVKARGMTAAELKAEKRNTANDPEDYFDYIMFAWGNCQAGDRLVMERRLGRFPSENELGAGFTAGVRFFFRYSDIIKHPAAVFDGVLPLKIKNELVLKDHLFAAVIPDEYRTITEKHIPAELRRRVHYIPKADEDIWQWSEKVYEYVKVLPVHGC